VEKLQKAARSLLEVRGEPAPDHGHIRETTDAIVSRFQSLSQQMAERSDLLQKSIAQSQSVQESLESLLHSVADIERSLSAEQPGALSAAAIQDSLATSAKLKQDIARQRSCLEATREMVTRFAETADGSTAAALQGKLAEAAERFGRLCQQQQEKEEVLKGLLPKVEQYEQLSEKLQQFMESRARMLASGNQPERDIARFSQHLQELNMEMGQQQEDLAALEQLAAELGASGFVPGAAAQQEKLQNLKEEFLQLQKVAKERERDASSCQEQLDEFRRLVAALRRWLKDSEGKVPPVDTSLGTQELQRRRQRVQEWSGKGPQVEELSHRGTLLENLIVEITAPDSQTKAGSVLPAVGGPLGSVNGFHTCKDLTEIQCDVSDVSRQYEGLGAALRERLQQLSAMLERMRAVQEEAGAVLQWLESKERTLLELEASSSPTKTETMRAQAEHNKAFLAELEQNSGKIQKVKEALSGLLEKYPDSPEAANWKKMQEDLNCRWERASQATAERQQKLEESANQLASFQAAEAQLRPWLMEKELMMSVLGPLSIDPNMLNAQKQQVQFMLKEFEARRQQHEQLNQAAQSILTGPGDVSPSTSQVREELQGVNQKWSELTERLNSRSSQIDQAIVKSTQYQELLQGLSEKVKAVGQRLSSQSAVSTQPDAVKQQLEETSEIRSDLEQLEEEIAEAQTLCDDLSVLIGEQYLKDELRKRLETVALPLKGLEDLAADRMNRLQTALASSQQFQHMFDELRTWLDDKLCQQARSQPISARLERLQSQIQEQEEFQKSLNQHSGSYEMIVAEGESLLLSVQPGEEKTALQNQLVSLKTHWEELSKQAADRHSKLKDCLQKAHKYQRHTEDLLPWVEDCKAKMSELEVTLDPVQLEATLLRSRALLSDVEKRRSVLEMLNSAADVLIDASQSDEDDIRDEKAAINQEMDAITEELQAKTGSIDEMSQRLKEFQESFKNIEKKLEGAKHQLEIFEALGPQACSNKNLEKLRAQQEALQALEPQVDYLKHFTRGLVEDAPDGSDCSQLLGQAEVAQEEFKATRQKVNDCCVLMENKLEGIGQFTGRVREMFSQLADLDDELDGMGPTGRDADSLQSQAEDVRTFLGKLQGLKADIEASESECKKMLEDEGSPDLLGLKRELETLSKQCSKLTERGRSRQEQVETTLARVEDFYSRLKELTHMTTAAEESEALQWVVGTEVETINQQLADFKLFQKEQVDPLQLKLQQVNGVGQGLIQSAGKNCDVQGLEHDMEEINTRWNTLNKKVAQRIAQLQEALLRCGKFQDALEPLLSWLADTEELISNQKPPSAEYKVVKAQIQEQKLLQRLLDDRKATVEMIQAEGGRIAQSAEPADREKISGQLQSLESRWAALLCRAAGRQKQLEDILVLAKQFHETTEPVSDWLSVTEKKLANSEPIGTQTAKIQQQISRHKALNEEIVNRKKNVDQAIRNGQALLKQTTGEEVLLIQEKLDGIKTRYSDITAASSKALRTLEQARQLATKFQSTHEELNAWMSKVEDELASSGGRSPASEQIPQFQQRQKELKKEVMEQRLVLDTVNEVSRALLELVPWRAREGLDKLVSDTNERYKLVSDTIRQRYEQAADAELAWVAETKRKLMALGAIRLEQDQTTAQLQVQKAFSIDIIRHKDSMDELFSQRNEIFGTCGEEQKAVLQEKTESLVQQYEAVSQLNSERYARLERAQVLVNQFWETYEELSPWIEETQGLISQLPPPAIDHEQLKQQQEDMRQLRESIAEHKPHIDKLLKIGPQLKDLNPEEGEMVQKKYSTAEAMYAKIKEEVCQRALALDEAVSQSTQVHLWGTGQPRPAADPKTLRRVRERQTPSGWFHSTVLLPVCMQLSTTSLTVPGWFSWERCTERRFPPAPNTAGTSPSASCTDAETNGICFGCHAAHLPSGVGQQSKCERYGVERLCQLWELVWLRCGWTLVWCSPGLFAANGAHAGTNRRLQVSLVTGGAGPAGSGQSSQSCRALVLVLGKPRPTEIDPSPPFPFLKSPRSQPRPEEGADPLLLCPQAEEFRTAVHMLLEWLSEAEQSLRFRGALPDDAEALQSLIDVHKEFMKKVEEKRVDVNAAVGMGEVILSACHPDCITTIKHWITIIRARFEEVLTWARQHQQRLEAALSELVANAELLEELLAWIQWAETTLIQRDQEPAPQNIDQVKALITEHQVSPVLEQTCFRALWADTCEGKRGFIPNMPRGSRKSLTQAAPPTMPIISQSETKNPRINQLSARWQQVWLLALERQRKLNDALDRLEELKEFANFDFDVWRKKYMRWMNHKKSRVMDFFRRIDKDQDGKITRQEFIDGILASKFPTTKLEMTAVADIFDRDGDGYIDYYEFVAALHPNKDAYRPTTDADKIEDEWPSASVPRGFKWSRSARTNTG
uniref:EF-hand domain-containing protein n=1 Tax=Pavo cristatus TaxID=9049 RepID=A0A8C9FYF4_PAVCR